MSGPFQNYVKGKFKKPGPLRGVRVLEVCTLLFGPAGPSFLGQMGAEVIKIELPPLGDVTRSLNPFGWFYKEQSPAFMHINPNKLYLALDLHIDMGQQIFRELAAKADIIEFNLRPGLPTAGTWAMSRSRKLIPALSTSRKTASDSGAHTQKKTGPRTMAPPRRWRVLPGFQAFPAVPR